MLPKYYQLAQNLPWILGILTILSTIGIIFCARSKRLGLRRVGVILLISGALLIADKFATDAAFNKFKDRIFSSVNNGQIQQSLTSFVHYVEAELAKINLWFGIVYIALAIILFIVLILTRNRKPGLTKEAKVKPPTSNTPVASRPQVQPSFDMINPNATAGGATQTPKTARQNLKKRSPPKPPRLIQ
jgi:hypothetical protein